ncbi:MAG: glycosyltransferase family 2 protein [Ginsengibacter sp.]
MVDIVIVNWNSGHYLLKCIQSILENKNEKVVNKVIIIDNDSTDDSLSKINSINKILIKRNQENVGFSKACNQGFKLCNAPFVLLLNPDAGLMDNTLQDCISFMESNRQVDILGCQLLDDNGKVAPSCARFPSPISFFYEAIGLSKIAPSIFRPATVMTDWDHKESKKVDQVMGAFMFMRRSIFDKLGYFDERFFVYFEELDFSKRLSEINGISFFNVNIKAFHSGEGTTHSVKAFRLFLFLRSRLQYAEKHFGKGGFLFTKLSTYFIEPISRCLFALLKGKPGDVREVIQAYKRLLSDSKN